MLNLDQQRQFIIEAGSYIAGSGVGYINDSDFEIIAEEWELSDDLKKMLGQDGVLSFPMDFENAVILDNESNTPYKLARVESAISHLFFSYLNKEEFRNELEGTFDGLDRMLAKLGNISGSAFDIYYKKNKVLIKESNYPFHDINGEKIELQKRKSVAKTVEKLAMDLYTKEYYPIISKTNHWRESWQYFIDRLTDLENDVSKNVSSKGTLYLSALPQDLMTMSINNYNWSSCFRAGGCNAHMPVEYMRNGNTMIAYYIPDDARNKTFQYAGQEVSNKPWRVLVYLTQRGNLAIGNKQYPNHSREMGVEIAKILAKHFRGDFIEGARIERSGNQYFEGTDIYIKVENDDKLTWDQIKEEAYLDWITDEKTVCVATGEYIGEEDSEIVSFTSVNELNLFFCEHCECHYSNDYTYSYTIRTRWGEQVVCEDCASSFEECYYSDNYINLDDGEHYLVIESDQFEKPVYCSEPEIDGLLNNGYVAITIYSVGRRHDSVLDRGDSFLVSPDVSVLKGNILRNIIEECNFAYTPEVFALETYDYQEENQIFLDSLSFDGLVLKRLDSQEEINEYKINLQNKINEDAEI